LNNFKENDINMPTNTLLMLIILLLLMTIHVVLAVVAVKDMHQKDNVAVGNKILWLFIVIFIGIIGPLIYFMYERK